ncbi:MAG TPA: type II toxin-antitoxin system RelE/ParE family toxin [Thermoanaerobaculia bacterium]|nr:type II toxin-antitoxin system RelE/ParE family toxin [Thermoanaerobaculia bacterium]
MKRITFDPGVQSDLRSTTRYLEKQEPGLGKDFMTRILRQFQHISLYPLAAPIVEGRVRKSGMEKFRYHVYYQVDAEEVFVIAVVHQRQHQDTWKKRL